jgi:hypothetical protein
MEPVSNQQFSKHVSAATETKATIEERYFYVVCAETIKQDSLKQRVSV